MKNSGRLKNTPNKISTSAKQELLDGLLPHLKNLNKYFKCLDFEERVIQLRHFAKILAVGDNTISFQTREVLWSQLEEHYAKMRFYFPHLKQEKKITELRQFLKLLPQSKIEEVIKDMKDKDIFRF